MNNNVTNSTMSKINNHFDIRKKFINQNNKNSLILTNSSLY